MSKKSLHKDNNFIIAVRSALDHYNDIPWLTTRCPLATPYFLGHAGDAHSTDSVAHQYAKTLRTELKNASKTLSQEQCRLLDIGFFERRSGIEDTSVAESLNVSLSTYYRHRNRTVAELAEKLAQKLVPPLRSEIPTDQEMVGRKTILQKCFATLQSGHSGYIYGASGAGKTTIGAKIASRWNKCQVAENNLFPHNEPFTFWYTIRLGSNDYIESFVFALGFFLRRHGAVMTWRQLVADQGKVNLSHIIGLIRFDLDNLQYRRLLLCVDDVDLLKAENLKHVQIINLVEELLTLTPVLLVGQRATIPTDQYYEVRGFEGQQLSEYLHHVGIDHLAKETLELVGSRTHGNPAIISMLSTLYQLNNKNLEEGLKALENAPSIEALYIRILKWLSLEQRDILLQLAIFRNPSPLDAWEGEREAIDHLLQYGLIQHDGHGGIAVFPHIRNIAYARISAEKRVIFHVRAAKIREERANVVSAMYHYIAANQPKSAIWHWYTNRKLEMEQGRGARALDLLQKISSTELTDKRDRNALLISRSEILKSLGEPEDAAADLDSISITKEGRVSAYVQELQANIIDMQGHAEQAIEKYRSALDAYIADPSYKEVMLRTRIGFLHEFSLQNRPDALQEALLARIRAEGFHGNMEEMAGNYRLARERYQAAYDIAHQLKTTNSAVLATVHSQLGILTLREGETDKAIELIEKAIEYEEKRGDVVNPLYDILNLAYAYTLAQDYGKSFEVATKGLKTAEHIKSSYLIAGLACGAGEACVGLGRLDDAEQYGHYSLEQEEGYFRCWGLALLGTVSTKRKKYEQAEKQLREAINNASEDKYGEAHCWHMLGNLYKASNRNSDARSAYETALSIYQELDLPYKIVELEDELIKVQCVQDVLVGSATTDQG